MTVRNTSLATYEEIIESGLVNKQQKRILTFLWYQAEGRTLKEISRGCNMEINAVSGRVNEMKKTLFNEEPILIECTKRKCTITGRRVVPVKMNVIAAQRSLELF